MSAPVETKRRGPPPGSNAPRQSVVSAQEAWGPTMPEWIEVLAKSCDRTSQTVVAKRLGYSSGVISAALKNSYAGNLAQVEKAVRGVLMAEELDCPVLGMIRANLCLGHQKRARGSFQPTSSLRVQLYRACRGGCMHSRLPITIDGGSDA